VDGAVRRVETAYDSQGNAYLVTTYDAASGGSVVTQVQRAYNGLGQLTAEYQSHGGAVNTSTTPKVQYAYSTLDSNNRSRLTSVTYPSGYVLTHNYSSGLNSSISRLSSLSDASGTVESYDYLGLGTVVIRGHSQPGVDLTYLKLSGESAADAGDQYTGLDRFSRIADQRWRTSSADVERTQYTYDRDGNRTARTNTVNSAYNEAYTYDGLNQLATFNRNSGARTQSWDYDAVGNWDSVTTNGGSPQTRTHNRQNEITAVSGATSPTFDANGNMTTDETGLQYTYDAWNRLKAVKSSGGTTLKTYTYDGLNRRVAETASGTTTDLYYSAGWQVLEEAVSGTTKSRYVWSPVYVDALILRDRDTDANGTLDERLWAVQDANYNVVALVNGSGTVVERYAFDSFGAVTVLNGSWTVIGSSAYAWQYLHQGGRLDATSGLYHFRMRDYSSTLGRWVTMDPIKYAGNDINLFRSYLNNSITYLDPSGLKSPTKVNIKYTTFSVGIYGAVMSGVKYELDSPADNPCGGWIFQFVRTINVIKGIATAEKPYYEAWYVKPKETVSETKRAFGADVKDKDAKQKLIDDFKNAGIILDNTEANDWFYFLPDLDLAKKNDGVKERKLQGTVFFIDKMKYSDMTWGEGEKGYPPAGGLHSAEFNAASRADVDKWTKAGVRSTSVEHILEVSWHNDAIKTRVTKIVPNDFMLYMFIGGATPYPGIWK
jgi:RHS repeat-associated protein